MAGGMLDITRQWPLDVAWPAAVEVVAAAFAVDPALLRAESRGRGPRPPEQAREPKKVAIYLAVILSGSDYASVGRHLGLHKDTVATHCAAMREATDDEVYERQLDVLTSAAAVRMELMIAGRGRDRGRLAALQAHMGRVFAAALAASDEPSDASSDDAKNNGVVIALARKGVAA